MGPPRGAGRGAPATRGAAATTHRRTNPPAGRGRGGLHAAPAATSGTPAPAHQSAATGRVTRSSQSVQAGGAGDSFLNAVGSPNSVDGVVASTGLTVVSPNDSNCGVCGVEVGVDGIGCDCCTKWFHPTSVCTGLTSGVIQIITGQNPGLFYKCTICRCLGTSPLQGNSSSLAQASHGTALDQQTGAQLFEMVRALTICVTKLTDKVADISASPSYQSGNVRVGPSDQSSSYRTRDELYSELWEFEDRKKRRESLIVKGLSCSSDSEFSSKFTAMTQTLTNTTISPDSVYCIDQGRAMYRVKINSFDSRKQILDQAKNLKTLNGYSQVYINRDLTFRQRQELRSRRQVRHRAQSLQANPESSNVAPGSGERLSDSGEGVTDTNDSTSGSVVDRVVRSPGVGVSVSDRPPVSGANAISIAPTSF